MLFPGIFPALMCAWPKPVTGYAFDFKTPNHLIMTVGERNPLLIILSDQKLVIKLLYATRF